MDKKWVKRIKKFFLPLVGILAFFAYLLIYNVDFSNLATIIAGLNVPLFIIAMLVGVVSVFFFAVSWRVLLSSLKISVPSKTLFLYVLYSLYADIVVPAGAVTGDVVRIYLIDRRERGVKTKVLASVLTQRLLGMALNIIVIALGIFLLFVGAEFDTGLVYYVALVGVLISCALVFVVVLIANNTLSKRIIVGALAIVDKVTRKRWRVSEKWGLRVDVAVEGFRESMSNFKGHPKVLAVSTIYLALNWFCSFSIPYIIFFSLGFPVPFYVALLTGSIVVAVRAIPVGIPFEIGIPDIAMATLFIALGVPATVSATVTILSRMVTLWFLFVLGFIAQQYIEIKPNIHF
jgi:uncharacterized protein (TIRG00374 family)